MSTHKLCSYTEDSYVTVTRFFCSRHVLGGSLWVSYNFPPLPLRRDAVKVVILWSPWSLQKMCNLVVLDRVVLLNKFCTMNCSLASSQQSITVVYRGRSVRSRFDRRAGSTKDCVITANGPNWIRQSSPSSHQSNTAGLLATSDAIATPPTLGYLVFRLSVEH